MNTRTYFSHRHDTFRLRQLARTLALWHFYRTLGYGWRESWGKVARTI